MKRLLIIILFVSFNVFSQTFEVVNKGYYYGKVGDTVLPNRTTDLKALTDVQEYLEKHNLEIGTVIRPALEVKRKRTSPTVIRDTVYINSDIYIGNQWMGEPIREIKATGNIISDTGGSHSSAGGLDAVFDGDLNTFRRANNQQGAWIGLDFGKTETIVKVRIYPHPQFNTTTMTLNGCLIQYSTNGTKWTTVHTITDAQLDTWYDVNLEGISARYFRVLAEPSLTYGGHIAELEFYKLL